MEITTKLIYHCLKQNYKYIDNIKLLFVGLVAILYGCTEAEVMSNDATVITVNEAEVISAEQVVDSVNFLVMDTSFNAYMSGIGKFDIHNDIIYCLAGSDAGAILAFDIKGRFLFKIERVGRAVNEWIALRHFRIDKINDRLILVDNFGRKLIITDLQGNFIESIPIKSVLVYDAISLPTGEFVIPSSFYFTGGEKSDYSKYKIHMFDNRGESIGGFIESTFNDNISDVSENELSMNVKGDVFYSPMFLNTIYTITNNMVMPCYSIVYKGVKDIITDEYISDIPEDPIRRIRVKDEEKYTFSGGRFIDSDRYVYVRMGIYSPIDVFYDKQTKKNITTRLFSWHDLEHKTCNTYAYQPPKVFYKDEWWAAISPSFFEIPQNYFEGEKSELYNEMRQIYDSHKEGCNMFVRYKLKNR